MIEKDNEILYRENDVVPQTGRYRCIVCGNIKLFTKDELFQICDNCMHGKDEDIWVLIEELEVVQFGSI